MRAGLTSSRRRTSGSLAIGVWNAWLVRLIDPSHALYPADLALVEDVRGGKLKTSSNGIV